MGYKTIEDRRKHYQKNKDEINRKRREANKSPGFKEKRREENRRWRENNREKLSIKNKIYCRNYDIKCKKLVFEHYGNKCDYCGEQEEIFLTIDHIDGGGEKHRKKIGRKINRWLVSRKFPKGFQTLCFNCNWGKHINGGICPHKTNALKKPKKY
jgi:hypothetical protein